MSTSVLIFVLRRWANNMKVYNFEQRTQEWYDVRLGRPTASTFAKIITATGKPSTQSEGLINSLVNEVITGEMEWSEPNEWMQRGIDLEPTACAMYELLTGNEVQHVGFCLHDTIDAGCSPDGLIGEDGGLEIKCPAPNTHIGYLRDNKCPSKYLAQVQGSMWVTGRDYWDFLSYHPDYPELLVRVDRDDVFISKLEIEVAKVLEKVHNTVDLIKEKMA